MNKIDRPSKEIAITSPEKYKELEDYFRSGKNGWKKSGEISYSQESHTDIPHWVTLEPNVLQIWEKPSGVTRLKKIAGVNDSKLIKLLKEVKVGVSKLKSLPSELKGIIYLANKNAKSTLDLIKDDPVDLK